MPLTRDEIIRQRYANGEGLSALGREYGLTPARIFQIVNPHKTQKKGK